MRDMGLLTEDPVPAGFTGTRLGVCNLCEAICGIELTLEDGVVTGIRGNEADPLSRGYICPKGVSMADVHTDPDRLRRPMRRIGVGDDARWEEIGWDEAYDLVADRLAATIQEHGADAVGVYLGNPNVHSVGFATHGVPFVKALRTRNRFSASTVDQIPHQFVAWQLYGHQLMLPIPDIDRTSFFLMFGANPMASNGSLMTVPDFPQRVRDLKARGGEAGGVRPAPHRDRQGRHGAPLRPARLRRSRAARHGARALRGGAHHSPAVRRPHRPGGRAGGRLHPRARRGSQRCPGGTIRR